MEMANSKTATATKKTVTPAPAKTTEKPAVTETAAVVQAAASTGPKVVTVVVVDEKSQPVTGANVSVSPSGITGTTDSSGEFHFTLVNYPKYDITASYGSNSATVPYYVTADGATRLVINPVYIKTVQAERSASHYSGLLIGGGIAVAVAIVLAVLWKMIQNRD